MNHELWTMNYDQQIRTMYNKLWTMNYDQQTMHDVRWTMDNKLLTKEDKIEQ